jgi:hypothetical protein
VNYIFSADRVIDGIKFVCNFGVEFNRFLAFPGHILAVSFACKTFSHKMLFAPGFDHVCFQNSITWMIGGTHKYDHITTYW